MYKLFLCLRYLRSRVIAYFAVLGVAVCVWMLVIVVSVLNGFVEKLESAAKGIFGHVSVSGGSLGGLKYYDELAAEIRSNVPEVRATTPFIMTVGLLRVPGFDYRKDVTIAGIKLPEGKEGETVGRDFYPDVSNFAGGLFVQRGDGAPSFQPSKETILDRLRENLEHIEALAAASKDDKALQASVETAWRFHSDAAITILKASYIEEKLARLQELLDRTEDGGDPQELLELRWAVGNEIGELRSRLTFEEFVRIERDFLLTSWSGDESDLDRLKDLLQWSLAALDNRRFEEPDRCAILGRGIPGLIYTTREGKIVRKIVPGNKVNLSLVPLGRKTVSTASITPVTAGFTVIDDCRTDVWTIDRDFVYVPFGTLQALTNMDSPPRCSQLLIKVGEEHADGEKLMAVAGRIRAVVEDFRTRHRDMTETRDPPDVETWTQRLADAVDMIQTQRTLSLIMFGIVSIVAVLLIFVMFYMIVVQKTRDIGVLKAIGASSSGVAGIFLAYGAAIGLVGSVIGTIGGYYFVRYINEIQNAVDRWWGFRPWKKEAFLFEKIPNEVDPKVAMIIMAGAVLAGLIGAIIPAVRAARMQPVEALRYE